MSTPTNGSSLLLELDAEYYLHIGAILAKWATLEYQLQEVIWAALDLEREEGRTLTIGMGMQSILGIMRNLHRKWVLDKSIQAEISSLVQDIKDNNERRNWLAHGVWLQDRDDPASIPCLSYMKTGDERILPGVEPLTPIDLQNFAKFVSKLNARADALLVRVRAGRESSP